MKWLYSVEQHGGMFWVALEWQRTMQVQEKKVVLLDTIDRKEKRDTKLVIITLSTWTHFKFLLLSHVSFT